MDDSARRFDAASLRAFVARIFETVGMPAADASAVAELMVSADLGGAEGHGIFRLPQYVRRIRAGGINLHPKIRVARERDGMALIDGDNGMGHLVMETAAQTAIAKAKRAGVAWVGVHHSNHAGPASLYARMPIAHDMIGLYLAVGNANHLPPWGGIDMLLSTNPIAVAVPALEEPPIVLDMASTVAAYGKVKTKAQRGEPLPEGWMMDRQGKTLTDSSRADDGFLPPIGGYKGYGLALVFGLLAGTLNGAANGPDTIDFNKDDRTPTNTGQAIVAIAIEAFGQVEAFKRDVDALIRVLRSSRRLPDVDRIWMPGEQSHAKRIAYEREGVPMAPGLLRQLNQLADELHTARLS
ncbi:MAG TPA: Ldh family oxidoreductase [Casimicrobiaceae bacterium]